ncbi:MAG: hypothetical protein HY900_20180, partial [Deltaproteobacteria bacterium]|nr:hypothetical protein [Deltaproteobacteria bacterium]
MERAGCPGWDPANRPRAFRPKFGGEPAPGDAGGGGMAKDVQVPVGDSVTRKKVLYFAPSR